MSRRDRAKIITVVIIAVIVGFFVLLDYLTVDRSDLYRYAAEISEKWRSDGGYSLTGVEVDRERMKLIVELYSTDVQAINAFKADFPDLPYKYVEFEKGWFTVPTPYPLTAIKTGRQ